MLSRHHRLLRALVITVVVLAIVVYIGIPAGFGVAVLIPAREPVGDPPQGFTNVSLITDDGVTLAAWFAEPQNGAVVIVAHGAGQGRSSVQSIATMLQQNGFGVLALDMRGFGASDGQINRLGWNGTHDIRAAVDYVLARNLDTAIGGLGMSMGAEILLGAASSLPELRAIAADGATFRSLAEYTALPENRTLLRNFTVRVRSFVVQLLSGGTPPMPLLESIQRADDTQVLFIAAGRSETEIVFNTAFHQAIESRSSLWVIPDVGHTEGFSADPDVYEQRVIAFFTDALLQ